MNLAAQIATALVALAQRLIPASFKGQVSIINGLTVQVTSLNGKLGNAGRTVVYTEPIEARPEDQLESLRTLVGDLKSGAVKTLLILSGNPVFNAPADLGFREALQKARRTIWRPKPKP